MDQAELQRRVLRRLLLPPAVVLPVVAGLTIVVLSFVARGFGGRYFYLLGAALLLLGLLIATANVLLRTGAVTTAVQRELDAAHQQQRQQLYASLRQRLEQAGDRRAALNCETLAAIEQRIDRGRRGEGFTLSDPMATLLTDLHASCLATLQRAVDLQQAGEEVVTGSVRAELLRDRSELLDEVDLGVRQLGETLDRLQADGLTRAAEDRLTSLRDDLEARLAIARRVEQRVAQLEQTLE